MKVAILLVGSLLAAAASAGCCNRPMYSGAYGAPAQPAYQYAQPYQQACPPQPACTCY